MRKITASEREEQETHIHKSKKLVKDSQYTATVALVVVVGMK